MQHPRAQGPRPGVRLRRCALPTTPAASPPAPPTRCPLLPTTFPCLRRGCSWIAYRVWSRVFFDGSNDGIWNYESLLLCASCPDVLHTACHTALLFSIDHYSVAHVNRIWRVENNACPAMREHQRSVAAARNMPCSFGRKPATHKTLNI